MGQNQQYNMWLINALAAGGARIVALSTENRAAVLMWRRSLQLQQVPPDFSVLAHLTNLSLSESPIQGGWQHLPRQLQQLSLGGCDMQQVPGELADLLLLTELSLSFNNIEGGWQFLARLQKLDLCYCEPRQLPAALEQHWSSTGAAYGAKPWRRPS